VDAFVSVVDVDADADADADSDAADEADSDAADDAGADVEHNFSPSPSSDYGIGAAAVDVGDDDVARHQMIAMSRHRNMTTLFQN